jgi:UDP-2,3-diacylglucosamine pyrophosphatase LpxH
MARTLIISDLHLGGRLAHDVLTRPEPLARLREAIHGVDRLVLLGDTVELMEGRPRAAFEIAAPILRSIAAAVGRDRELIVVPGNHDGALVWSWIRQARPQLTVDTLVAPAATAALSGLIDCLSPAPVRVRYPGVWLADRVWATHGHYLDRHLLPESAVGIARERLRRPEHDLVTPMDYELHRSRASLSRFAGRVPRPLAVLLEDAAELLRAATMPGVDRRILNERIAPLTAALLSLQMRRASMPALAHVARRLGVEADWVLFGHVHRLGPLDGDDLARWRGPAGTPRLANSGSWLYEPLLLHRAAAPHPYWPGGALLLEDGSEPRAVGLLDDLGPETLRAPRMP